MAVDKNKKKALDAEITDALLDDFDKFEHFATTYWKQIAGVAAAIVIGVALWVVIADARKTAEKQANDAICNARTEKELLSVIKAYPGYPAANDARLRLAKLYLNEKKYDRVYEQFRALRASDLPREMVWRINLDEAYTLELEGKKEAAAAKFAAVGADVSLPDELGCEAHYGAGRLYFELKKNNEARKYLNRASVIKPGMYNQAAVFWVSQAKFILVRLPESSQKIPAESVKPPRQKL
ncbi:MAG: hypothetical protein PHH77_00835 [Victivallaceae bacterium]|nr:hypothetical protein [Victivallaceae bacterium]